MLIPWPHQVFCVNEVLAKLSQGYRRILVVSPCGGGKTFMMGMLFQKWIGEQHFMCGLYANRKLLLDQLSGVLDDMRIAHGMRAAGRAADASPLLQVSSIQTEASRGGLRRRKCPKCGEKVKAGVWKCVCGFDLPALDASLYLAQRVIIDEAHLNASPAMQHVADTIIEHGGSIVGFTGTPLGLGHMYETKVVAGTASELRKYGAIVPAVHYAPDEPDLRALGSRLSPGEDLTEKQAVAAVMTDGIFGRVIQWFTKLNPHRRPTLLFAPGVRESLGFAEAFRAAGIPAAHIDGTEVWLDGEFRRTGGEAREDVIDALRRGVITVLCNRFVLREGIDLPFVRHVIAGTIFGSVQTYLQALCRGGRADRDERTNAIWGPKLDYTVQDHGGNYHLHGSLNADRTWDLGHTSVMVAHMRADALRAKKCVYCGFRLVEDEMKCRQCGKSNEIEQRICPECTRVIFGRRCPCGYTLPIHRSRIVVQHDGSLVEVNGDIYKPRRICKARNGVQRWVKVYFRSKNARKRRPTFKQAFALFAKENQWGWPDLSWPYMPIEAIDHFSPVADVPYDKLVSPRKHAHE